MRKINEIVSDAAQGNIPSHEECYYALLALRSKLHFYHRDLIAIAEAYERQKVTGVAVALRANSRDKVMKDRIDFSNLTPLEFLGESGNPFTEENKKWRDMADKIYDKAMKNVQNKKNNKKG
jgi:hypothetical protein